MNKQKPVSTGMNGREGTCLRQREERGGGMADGKVGGLRGGPESHAGPAAGEWDRSS